MLRLCWYEVGPGREWLEDDCVLLLMAFVNEEFPEGVGEADRAGLTLSDEFTCSTEGCESYLLGG